MVIYRTTTTRTYFLAIRYVTRLVTGHEARRKVAVEYVTKGLASSALSDHRSYIQVHDIVGVHRYLESSGQFGKIVVTL